MTKPIAGFRSYANAPIKQQNTTNKGNGILKQLHRTVAADSNRDKAVRSFSAEALNYLPNSPVWPMTASTVLLANSNVISTAGLLLYTQYTINCTITCDVISTVRYGRHNGLVRQTPIRLTLMYVKAQRLLYVQPGCSVGLGSRLHDVSNYSPL
jgi:hypothetical protein